MTVQGAQGVDDDQGAGADPGDHDRVRVRRAPKFPAFLLVGGAIGAIVALILTTTREVDPEVGMLQMFLFLALFCVVGGVLLAGIAALIFDRVFSRRAAVVDAEHTRIARAEEAPHPEPAADGPTAAPAETDPPAQTDPHVAPAPDDPPDVGPGQTARS